MLDNTLRARQGIAEQSKANTPSAPPQVSKHLLQDVELLGHYLTLCLLQLLVYSK
jgi:hypothetical protein